MNVSPLPSRLADDLLHCILKTVVRESCLLVTKCQTVARDDFQKLLSTVPVRATKPDLPLLRSLLIGSCLSAGGLAESPLPHGRSEPPSEQHNSHPIGRRR